MTDLFNYTTLKRKYRNETIKDIKELEKQSKVLGRYSSHLRFNLHCKHNDVIPKYAKVKTRDDNHEVREIIHKAERAILNVHISLIVKKKKMVAEKNKSLRDKVKQELEEGEYKMIEELTKKAEENAFNKTRDIQKKKFNNLKNGGARQSNNEGEINKQVEDYRNNNEKSDRWIKNISDIELTPEQITLLKKGGNYSVSGKSIPTEEYIVAVEQAARYMTRGEAAAMRAEVVEVLEKTGPPKSNLTKAEREAMKQIKQLQNNDIVIAPADKGRCLVIMNKKDYMGKMEEKLKDETTYKQIKDDPTKEIKVKIVAELTKIRDNNEIDEKMYKELYPNRTQIPRMYGLPKIHKQGYPLREIVDACGGLTADINKHISKIIKPYAGNEYSVKNSKHLISIIKDIKLEDDETLVSYDVKALYPSVPQKEAIELISDLLHQDKDLHERTGMKAESIVKLLKLCVENTYFTIFKRIFVQVDGLAIGASTSGFAADIFMYRLEKKALTTFANPPSLWGRYVDDTIAKLKKVFVEQFMLHLNAQHNRIEFTDEQLKNNKLAFLDAEINVMEDGGIKVRVYKKTTHTDQYLMFHSNHHIGQKLGIVSTLKHRIETIVTTEEDKRIEEESMKKALRECGYPEWALSRKKKKRGEKEVHRGKVVMPYTKSLSEKIARILRKYNVAVIHKPTSKLRTHVCNMKEKVHPMDKVGAIYEVVCEKHGESYTGETKRALKERGYEHKVVSHKESEESHSIKGEEKQEQKEMIPSRRSTRNTKRVDYKMLSTGENIVMNEGSTEVSKHMARCDHEMGDVKLKAIAYDNNWFTRGIREAIEIKKRNPTLNEDDGRYYIQPIYDKILKRKKKEDGNRGVYVGNQHIEKYGRNQHNENVNGIVNINEEMNISNQSPDDGGRSQPIYIDDQK